MLWNPLDSVEAQPLDQVEARAPETCSVFLVEDDPGVRKALSKLLRERGHTVREFDSAQDALAAIKRERNSALISDVAVPSSDRIADVIVTDINMPHMSGIDLLRAVKELDPEIQVIVLTGDPHVESAVDAVRLKADDYLVKPFDPSQLIRAVRKATECRALARENRAHRLQLEEKVREQARQIERLFLEGLHALAAAIEARDGYTGGHLDRVTHYALATGSELGLDQQPMWNLWLGSLFHDVGKLAIPDAILNKDGPLTAEEYSVMKRHPEFGIEIIERISFLRAATRGILDHQERWDGKGYPAGLRGEEISIEGRILAVCDAFDAMLTDRPYRKPISRGEAIEELKRCAGTQFDPKVVEAFLNASRKGFPVDSSIFSALRLPASCACVPEDAVTGPPGLAAGPVPSHSSYP